MTYFYPCPLYIKSLASGAIGLNVSRQLVTTKQIAEILMIFPSGTLSGLLYQFFFAPSPPTILTALPNVPELTTNTNVPGIFPGDGIAYSIPFQYQIPSHGYLVFAATNNTSSPMNCSAIAILQE